MPKLLFHKTATILFFFPLLLSSMLAIVACGEDRPKEKIADAQAGKVDEPADVIARVGDEIITFGQLNAMLNSSAMVGVSVPELGTSERNQVMIDLLDSAISANLVYLDARKKGVDRLSAYKEDVDRFEGRLLATMYKTMLMQGEVKVSETEVLHHYNTQSSREIELNDETRSLIEAMIRKQKLDLFEASLRDRVRENVDVVINDKVLNSDYDNKRSGADVVASYNHHRISWSQVKELMQNANRNASQTGLYITDNEERRTRLEQHLDNAIMALKGRAAGLEDDPLFVKRSSEYRKARLINEHRNGLIHSWNPDDETLRAYYDSNKAMFTIPEARRVQVVTVDTREQAETLLAQIRANELMIEQAAMEHSTDPQTRHTQGHIGWISRGSGLVDYEDLIFSLEPEAVSDPVESGAGWHLVKVLAIDGERLEKLENPQTRERAFKSYMQERFNDYVVDLRKNDFDVVIYQDELERQFKREADFIAELNAQKQPEAGTQQQQIEELQQRITTLPQ